ncbi:Maf family protein [Maritalea mobilis]|uniref:Maf family protein n=1 Tax=Maritalea mobilis TaxID=483324 RepID=UPI0021BBE321|nr:Maf family protein [Maritalea mobilis]
MADLVLASGSEIRRQMLENAGVSVDVRPVRIDEVGIRSALEAEGATPRDVADTLAEFKARKAVEKFASPCVLASDQVLELKGRIFGKADTREEAAAHLAELSGRQHRLLSAAVIYEDGAPVWRHVGEVRMTMHPLTAEQIDRYLDRAWPEVSSSVGAYQAEKLGAQLFSRMDGDWFSVLGLPLLELLSFLRLKGWIS